MNLLNKHLYVYYEHYPICKLYVWLVWFIDIIEVTGKRRGEGLRCKKKKKKGL